MQYNPSTEPNITTPYHHMYDDKLSVKCTTTYIDNHHRAQFKFLLSQINPNLNPRLRKANTKDVAVQVNPKDVSVQCSLGPRTLIARKRDTLRKRRQETQTPGSPGSSVGGVRYPRTLAVYSPIASRRLTSTDRDLHLSKRHARISLHGPLSVSKIPYGKNDWNHFRLTARFYGYYDTYCGTLCHSQFLEQKYGYYHCRDCNLRWESAYVWCVHGTSKVYFKQFCRTCQKSFNPYRVEDITCQTCNKARCMCQDLCGRCKGKRLSCDLTFSFKYII
uniref:Zygote arrest 1 n=1 Tax=Oncorhynchus mykiss TaxID=8022 RepID=A0A8C7LZR9_ONCMY